MYSTHFKLNFSILLKIRICDALERILNDEHCLDKFFVDLSVDTSDEGTHQDPSNQSSCCDCNEQSGVAAAVDVKQESLKVECNTSYDEQTRSAVFSGSKIEPNSLEMSKGKITIPVIKDDADVKHQSSMDVLPHEVSITPDNASGLILTDAIELADVNDDAANGIHIDLNPEEAQSAEITVNREQNVDDPTVGLDALNTPVPDVNISFPDVNDATKSVAGQSQPRIRRRKNVTFAENPNKSNKLPNGANATKCFKCDVCDYSTEKQALLKAHSRIHSDIGKYKCEICEKRYRQKAGLNYHLRSHGHLFAFQCTRCRMGFEQEDEWQTHENRCKIKSYECYLCGHQFNHQRKANCLAHMRRMHFGDDPSQFTCSRRCCRKPFHAHPKSNDQSKQRLQKSRQ